MFLPPRIITPTEGLIIYPGALIDSRAYAVLAQAVAKQGILVAIVPMPLNLAILDPNRASKPIAKVYRHSDLGYQRPLAGRRHGVHICQKEFKQNRRHGAPGSVSSRAPTALPATTLPVLSLWATNDGLTTEDEVIASEANAARGLLIFMKS